MRYFLTLLFLLFANPAWAALPTILVNSATGSDSTASGAGPATALTGTAASVAGTATSVSITDAVDLSGVATDGSAVLYYADSTAGHRNFDNITAISGSSGAWTVTVKNGFTTSTGPFSWAIGGKRQTLSSATSKKLFMNSSTGDAMPGWTVQLDSGYTETISSTFTLQRGGSSSSTLGGPIILQGDPAATTIPIITFSNNGNGFVPNQNWQQINNIEIQNSNATKTASVAIASGTSQQTFNNIKIDNATNNFWKGITINAISSLSNSTVAHCANVGVSIASIAGVTVRIINNYIHDNGASGLAILGSTPVTVIGNIFYNNTGDGVSDANQSSSTFYSNNTFDSNTTNGLEYTSSLGSEILVNINNIYSNNGNYGINFSSASMTSNYMTANMFIAENNDFYNNTSGKYNPSYFPSNNESTLNPSYTNAASGDFSIGSNLANLGYPLGGTNHIGNYSSTYSYSDIGAAQRQCTGGAGGTVGYTSAQ